MPVLWAHALCLGSGTAATAPFVLAMTCVRHAAPVAPTKIPVSYSRAGIKVLPGVVNAGIFTSAFSAGNSALFASSRILYGMALRGHAPRFLTICTSKGLPIASILVTVRLVSSSFISRR